MIAKTEALDALKEFILGNLKAGAIENLLFNLGIIGLDSEWFHKFLFSHYDSTTTTLDIDKVAEGVIDKMEENLQYSLFLKKIQYDEYESIYDEGFQKLISAKILADTLFLGTLDHNLEIIVKYADFLLSKKRQLNQRDKWGDFDPGKWHELLSEFIAEKLEGYDWASIYRSLPEVIKNHLRDIGQSDYSIVHIESLLEKQKSALGISEVLILSGFDYEVHLADRLQSVFPNAYVTRTPLSGDQGADIIVSIGNRKIAIQAKYYAGSVGNAAVQEVYAAMRYYDADECMVVCNSDYTSSAKSLASKTGVILTNTENFLSVIGQMIGGKLR